MPEILHRIYYNDFVAPTKSEESHNLESAYYLYFNNNKNFDFKILYEKFKSMEYFAKILVELNEVKRDGEYILMHFSFENFSRLMDPEMPFLWNIELSI